MTATLEPPAPQKGLRRLLGSPIVGALTAPHGIDRYLAQVNPMWSVHAVNGRIVRVRHLTPDTVTLTIAPTGNFNGFRAGQYVRVTVEIDGVRRTRCYSIASSQHGPADRIELTVKAHPDGTVSRYLVDHARAGMVLGLSQAEGRFTLPATVDEPLLLISGGSGVTPVMGMLRTLCDEGHTGPITFLHYAFTSNDIIYGAELRKLAARHSNVRLVLAYTEQTTGGDLHGFFDRSHLAAVAPDASAMRTYLCGPPGLMKSVQEIFAEDGLTDRLTVEEFTLTKVAPAVEGEVSGQLCFVRSRRQASNTGDTVLAQAEAAGLNPESGCRMGICHTCVRHKPSGQVRNVRTGVVSGPDAEDIQICISVPVGDVEVDL